VEGNKKQRIVTDLFGGERGDDAGAQSLLLIDDVLSCDAIAIEIRDGVRIDPRTSTAMIERKSDDVMRGFKFDWELLPAGTTFDLRFELLIPKDKDTTQLKQSLACVLQGLANGDITLGARKRRGFGQCRVKQWRVVDYDLSTTKGLLYWIKEDESKIQTGDNIAELLGVILPKEDAREYFALDATFDVDGSLLIRAEAESGASVDAGHLHSRRPGEKDPVPVLPGTSIAGVLRHRALRIANTLAPDGRGAALVDAIFGSSDDKNQLTASRLWVKETVVKNTRRLVQSRVKIDRFTGGAYPTALFSEEPVWGGQVKIKLRLQTPKKYEVGLLLLLLKDLWTGDLPMGGERSVGRGRLVGKEATLCWRDGMGKRDWVLTPGVALDADQPVPIDIVEGDKADLEACVVGKPASSELDAALSLITYLQQQEANHAETA
jgi:CRISPR/Cas system CSM-associated protein Csm3 (group 7 of RAMP superfamily)